VGRLLATIKSRCVKINIATPKHSISYQWLKQHTDNKQQDDIQLSLLLANGAPLQAREILQNDTLELVQSMLNDLKSLQNNKASILEISKHWFSNELYENMPYIASYYLFLLKLNSGINTMQNSDGYNIDKSCSHIIDLEHKILNFVSKVNKFIKRSETTLKKQLLIEELLINWHNDFKVDFKN
jgi:DNA polymerase-3 subunit delta'